VAQQSVIKMIEITVMNNVTPKSVAKHELLFNKLASASKVGFDKHLSRTYSPQQSVTKFKVLMFISLVTPKVAAKLELLLNKTTLGVG
jgi:hypothetical protein